MTDDIGNNRLSDFVCNKKFFNSLSGIVTAAKNDFDVKLVYVWQMEKYIPSNQLYGHTKDMVIALTFLQCHLMNFSISITTITAISEKKKLTVLRLMFSAFLKQLLKIAADAC